MDKDLLLLLSGNFYYKPVELRKILSGFQDLKEVMTAPKDAFLNLGVGGKALDNFLENRAATPLHTLADDIKIITILDANYPAALKNAYDPPPILFYRGDLSCLSVSRLPSLAVIGSRKMSEYGKRACELFVNGLCKNFIIVSGLAFGVDGLSHEITVKNKQKTIAVLGSGIDEPSIYPKSNISLARKILDCGGLLLSEVPPGIGPQKFHFPMRNRIISGISRGILIIEGGKKSGTLITAKLGLDLGTDIFAVPGNIFSPNSEGVNFLIKCGAHPVTESRDILEFYGMEGQEEKNAYVPKTEKEKIILEILSASEKHINDLAEETGIGIMDLMDVLTDLEISGAIKNIGGQRFIRI